MMSPTNAPVPVPLNQSAVPSQHPAYAYPAPQMFNFKNRLQEYSQRSSLPLPMYTAFNEGTCNAPKFRATVCVAGESYSSQNTFSKQKAAEQDAARVALEQIFEKMKNEKFPIVYEDLMFCKSILHEYAVKMNLKMPTYTTVLVREKAAIFRSSVVFNGVTYTGEFAQNKKDAEQLGARAVILSLLGNPAYLMSLTEIINSKAKIYSSISQVKDSCNAGNGSQPTGVKVTTEQVENPLVTHQASTDSTTEARPLKQLSCHEFNLPRPEQLPNQMRLPISFVNPVVEQPLGVMDSCDGGNNSQPAEVKVTVGQAKHVEATAETQPPQQLPCGFTYQLSTGATAEAQPPQQLPCGATYHLSTGVTAEAQPPQQLPCGVTYQLSTGASAEAKPLQQLPCNEFSLPGPEHLSDNKRLPNSFVISVSGHPLGVKDSRSGENGSHPAGVKVTSDQVGNNVVTHHASTVTTEACPVSQLPCHELFFSRSGQFSDAMKLPISSVTPVPDQHLGVTENNKRKRRKNKKRANKKLHSDVLPGGGVPVDEQ